MSARLKSRWTRVHRLTAFVAGSVKLLCGLYLHHLPSFAVDKLRVTKNICQIKTLVFVSNQSLLMVSLELVPGMPRGKERPP
jgi:hypothetical protein